MADSPLPSQSMLSIAAVERNTGLGKDTLRVWERRYQFPQPGRDANGERVYPPDQVAKLRLIKRLIDRGYRPGKIIHFDLEALHELNDGLLAADSKPVQAGDRADLLACLELCKTHQVEALRRNLSQALLRVGLQKFVVDVIAPLNHMVGENWAKGVFAVYEEHLYTEAAQNLLRNAISAILQRQGDAEVRPVILLTTFPQEQHGLGILMAEAIFALEGARCISLGVQTPIADIVRAAEAQAVDIVALSFSSAINARQAVDGLAELSAALPPEIEVWVGGTSPALSHRGQKSARALSLSDVPAALEGWRQRLTTV
ncbi:HTH-type transcriptional repressor CarH [soil metagenome]